jgi:Spy/CpxP family protein refolding chaperone
MNQYLKTLALIVIFGIFVTVLNAQNDNEKKPENKKTPEQVAQTVADNMKNKLDLTDEQYQKVYALQKQFVTDKRSLKGTYTIENMKEFREKMKEKNVQYMKDIKQILTDDQQKKFKKMAKMKKHKKRMRRHRGF